MGRNQSDRQRRTDEVMYFVEDAVAGNIHYHGRTDLFSALTSDPVWQIKRIYRTGNTVVTTYANDGKYNCIWDDRVSYFSAATPGAESPQTFPIVDENGDPFTSTNPLDVTASFSGLRVGGKVTEVTLSAASWTALPAAALSGRNAISIQNISAVDIKLNYILTGPLPGTYTGVTVPSGAERFYDLTDTIVIYAKAKAGSPIVVIEEIS